jgi:hypothetical protein
MSFQTIYSINYESTNDSRVLIRICELSTEYVGVYESRCRRSNILWISRTTIRLVIAEDDLCYRKFTGLYESAFFCNSMRYLATRERFVKSMRLYRDNWSGSNLSSLFSSLFFLHSKNDTSYVSQVDWKSPKSTQKIQLHIVIVVSNLISHFNSIF